MDFVGTSFEPMELSVDVNATPFFLNSDGGSHTVTIRDPTGQAVKDAEIDSGEHIEHTFVAEGSHAVVCRFHGEPGEGMQMTVHVS